MSGYKCASVGCYSYLSPETNTLFQKLQTLINQFAPAVGIAPLKTPVDGIIGRGTTEAALYILISIAEGDKGAVGSAAAALEAGISSTEQLATNAQAVVDVLTLATRQSALASQVVAAVPLPPPSSGPSLVQKATTSANATVKTASPQVQAKLNAVQAAKPALAASLADRIPPWVAYTGGGALLVGALAAVALSVRKRRGKGSSVPAVPASVVAGARTLTQHLLGR